jgi:hypothetical protein
MSESEAATLQVSAYRVVATSRNTRSTHPALREVLSLG